MKITMDTMVEEVFEMPGVLEYCLKHRVSVFSCAGAYPQSFGSLLRNKKVEDPEAFLDGLNDFLDRNSADSGRTDKQ